VTVDDPKVLAELTAAFEAYETALMANDINALDAVFRRAPQTLRYGVGENLYGYDEIAAFRKARPGGSPQRVLTRTVITTYGDSFGVANTEFRREGASVSGRQSQSWVRGDDGWQVVAAHVSLMADGH
jgi:hypothetical protein